MPLPFLAGLAIGAGAVIAYNKSEKIKTNTNKFIGKSKEFANETFEKTKKYVDEIKENICSKKETKTETKQTKSKEEK